MLVRAVAVLLDERPDLRSRLVVPVVGGPSGSGLAKPEGLQKLAARLGVADVVRFRPPVGQDQLADWFRAASVLVMPSYSESFGLVAIEAQAAGTPVLAAAVGGLPVAVRDGRTGFLVQGHDPAAYARVLRDFADDPRLTDRLGAAAPTTPAPSAGTSRPRPPRRSTRRPCRPTAAAPGPATADVRLGPPPRPPLPGPPRLTYARARRG
ncbi:hypothetical protein GCM10020295_45730 [Streptomyces cinereospinus]